MSEDPLADLDLQQAIDLRWTLRDIKAKRWLTPINPIHLKTLLAMGLIEIRGDEPLLTNSGISAILWPLSKKICAAGNSTTGHENINAAKWSYSDGRRWAFCPPRLVSLLKYLCQNPQINCDGRDGSIRLVLVTIPAITTPPHPQIAGIFFFD
jgi:hypothetical protein